MSTQSIKSDALEPDLDDLRGKGPKALLTAALRLFPVYGLVFVTLILIAIFSFLLPDTFLTWINARLIMSSQSTTALLALAAMIPMVAEKLIYRSGTVSCSGKFWLSACRRIIMCRGP